MRSTKWTQSCPLTKQIRLKSLKFQSCLTDDRKWLLCWSEAALIRKLSAVVQLAVKAGKRIFFISVYWWLWASCSNQIGLVRAYKIQMHTKLVIQQDPIKIPALGDECPTALFSSSLISYSKMVLRLSRIQILVFFTFTWILVSFTFA